LAIASLISTLIMRSNFQRIRNPYIDAYLYRLYSM